MSTFSGRFVPIERPGATTPPFDGPGTLTVGDPVVLSGGRHRPWISRGAGCIGATGALIVGLAVAIAILEFVWDFTQVRKGTSLIAMGCLFLMMVGWGAGTKLVDLLLGRRDLRLSVPVASLEGARIQGPHVVLAWSVGGASHLAFFVPAGAAPEAVLAALGDQGARL